MAGGSDFKSNGLLLRLMGLMESLGTGRGTTGDISTETLTLSGYLKDENGNAIANATLGVEANTSANLRETVTTVTKTDSDGRYTLTLKIGTFTIRVTNSSGTSLGTFSVQASSKDKDPIITISSGTFVVTILALNNGATSAPNSLTFSGSPYTFTRNIVIDNKIPTYSGSITSCRSIPSLPTGLNISSTCVISGTPTVNQNATSYHIVATNTYGNSSVTIMITVNQVNSNSNLFTLDSSTLDTNSIVLQ